MMKDYYKVEGSSHLTKNPRTGTILNTNVQEIESARKRKRSKKELESEIADLRSQVQRLTSAVEQLLEK